MRGSQFVKPLVRFVFFAIAVFLLGLAAVALWPAPTFTVVFHPAPSYEAARERGRFLRDKADPEVRPECRSEILDHGRRTKDVYVLLHGLTNCPAQFHAFAEQIYARGANVISPRLPFHGFVDRLTTAQANLTASDLLATANEAVDLARGYGDRVVVIGLSVNGVTAAWLAQTRDDVDLAVIIAPFFAPADCPAPLIAPLANLLRRLPNVFVWWDARQKEALVGSPFSYPRFATRSLGETLTLGLDVFSRAARFPPQARRILFVTSTADTVINLARVRALASRWGDRSRWEQFPAPWKVPHDCIDSAQPGAQVNLVYPQLLEWIDSELHGIVFPSPRRAFARD